MALSPYFADVMRIQAGEVLADLALGRIVPPTGRLYAFLGRGEFTWPELSELARRDEWRITAE